MLKLGYLSGRLYGDPDTPQECVRFVDEETARDPHVVAKLAAELRKSCEGCGERDKCLDWIKRTTPYLHVL